MATPARTSRVKIGACFIAGILALSLLSRLARIFELRVTHVEFDDMAARFVRDTANRTIRLIANEPDNRDKAEYREKVEQIRADNDIFADAGELHRPQRPRPRCSCPSGTRPGSGRASTSSGPRAIHSPTSYGSSSSGRARSRPSPAR